MNDSLNDILSKFSQQRIGVVGDLMLDRYIWGRAERISQEAPVPVVRVMRRTTAPGGAANVLRNLAELGGQAVAFGVVGQDSAGDTLRGELNNLGVNTDRMVATDARVTTEKTRVIAEHQQVVRVDQEEDTPIEDSIWTSLTEGLSTSLENGDLDALVIEDYAKGLLDPHRISTLAAMARQHGVPVALDPHPANRTPSRDLSLMTPNRAEAFALAGSSEPRGERLPFAEDAALHDVADTLLRVWGLDALLITLGPDGMALFQTEGKPTHVPTRAQEVYDVSGAGDTVIATYMLATQSGATPEDAIDLANHAAGVVVGKLGTAPVTLEELREACAE